MTEFIGICRKQLAQTAPLYWEQGEGGRKEGRTASGKKTHLKELLT